MSSLELLVFFGGQFMFRDDVCILLSFGTDIYRVSLTYNLHEYGKTLGIEGLVEPLSQIGFYPRSQVGWTASFVDLFSYRQL